MGFVKYSALCVMKCGLPNFDLGICYGLLYGSTLVIGIPITLLRWMIHWLIFKFFGGRVRRKKIRHNRGLELKRKAQIRGIWGVLHTHYIEETEKGV